MKIALINENSQAAVSYTHLAAILAGLILAGILAATMSTADSQMLAAASSVSQNILQEFGHMKPVSYTHLDVYKRQVQDIHRLRTKTSDRNQFHQRLR